MRLKTLKISNVLCFKYYENLESCPAIKFKKGLNIFIGTNGSGKTTALEAINCALSRVLFPGYTLNEARIDTERSKEVIKPTDLFDSYQGLRLHKNRNSPNNPSRIEVIIELDSTDRKNIKHLISYKQNLFTIANQYSNQPNLVDQIPNQEKTKQDIDELTILIELKADFKIHFSSELSNAPEFLYLRNFEFYKQLIELNNNFIHHKDDEKVEQLTDPFVMISGYRNYNQFTHSASLQKSATQQMQDVNKNVKRKSLNESKSNELEIVSIIILRLAKSHFDQENGTSEEKHKKANNQEFIKNINEKLKIINLKLNIKRINKATWEYALEIIETLTNAIIDDINHLSSGQKAILHLILESYGRGELKGGLVIIDEPELHLHYQFQYEFVNLVEELIKELKTQYIFVTHSECLINHKTINSVTRFFLDSNTGEASFCAPVIKTKAKWLIKILENSRSIGAFFASKVVLVEGETDLYFYREVLNFIYPNERQNIFMINVNGKGNFKSWIPFFEDFNLTVYVIADLDYANNKLKLKPTLTLNTESQEAAQNIQAFRDKNTCLDDQIDQLYKERTFILKLGGLEQYLDMKKEKDLQPIIKFCRYSLTNYINKEKIYCQELKKILKMIVGINPDLGGKSGQ